MIALVSHGRIAHESYVTRSGTIRSIGDRKRIYLSDHNGYNLNDQRNVKQASMVEQ